MRPAALPMLGAVLGTLVAWVAIPLIGALTDRLLYPPSRWLEVSGVEVGDAGPGESPSVRVTRTINRPFSGRRSVTLLRATGENFASYCTRHSQNDYRVGAVLPEATDLDWWMEIPINPPCRPIAPGRYIVAITWTLDIPGLKPRSVRAESNVFEVRQ